MTVPGLGGKLLNLDTRYEKNRQGYTFTEDAIKDARTRGIKWIIVAMHKNYISAMEKDNEISTDADRSFMSMLLAQKVDLILQGHEHGYERSRQLTTNGTTCGALKTDTFNNACVVDSDNDLVKGRGTVIHVLGTGGKGLRHIWTDDAEYPYFAQSDVTTWGFGKFTVSSTALSFAFQRSTGGNLADSFTITEAH